LDIDCHLVREKSQAGLMRLHRVSSSNQLADIFTKALPPRAFGTFLSKLGLVNLFDPPACGGNKERRGPSPRKIRVLHNNIVLECSRT